MISKKIKKKEILEIKQIFDLDDLIRKYEAIMPNLYGIKLILEEENMIIITPERILKINLKTQKLIKESQKMKNSYEIKAYNAPLWSKQGKSSIVYTSVMNKNTFFIDKNLKKNFNFPLEFTNILLTKIGKFRYMMYTKDHYGFEINDSYGIFNIDTKKRLLNINYLERKERSLENLEEFLYKLIYLTKIGFVTKKLIYQNSAESIGFLAKEGNLNDRSLKSVKFFTKFDKSSLEFLIKNSKNETFKTELYKNYDISSVDFISVNETYHLYVLIYDQDSCTEASKSDYSLLLNFTLLIFEIFVSSQCELEVNLAHNSIKFDQIFRHIGVKVQAGNIENSSSFPLVNGFSLQPSIGGYKNGFFSFDSPSGEFFQLCLNKFLESNEGEDFEILGFEKENHQLNLFLVCKWKVFKLIF